MPTKLPAAARCVLLMITASASAFAAEPPLGSNVEGLLALARARNPELAAMRHEITAAQARAVPAAALMPPRFKMELQDITRSDTQIPSLLPGRVGAAQYTLSQDLPWAGKRALRSQVAAREVDAAQARATQTWLETAARIKATYLQRYLVKATERLISENLDLMLQLEKVLQVRYAGGLSAQQDITRIHVEHTGMRIELAALAGEWRLTQTRLNALLARPADAPLATPEQLRPLPSSAMLSLPMLSERLQQSSPALQAEVARVASAEKTRDLTLKNRYPDFTLGLSAMQRRGTVNEWGLMLELNLPIQGDVLRAQERESAAMLASAQARQDASTREALTDLSAHLSALETARHTEHLMTFSLMPQAELTWRAALAGYENGKADFATLLDAQRQIRTARLGQLKSQVEAQLRLAEIERLIGEDL